MLPRTETSSVIGIGYIGEFVLAEGPEDPPSHLGDCTGAVRGVVQPAVFVAYRALKPWYLSAQDAPPQQGTLEDIA